MKRVFCLLLALVLLVSLGASAFADDVLYCRICGKKIPADSNVCPYCGVAVVHADGTVATVTQVPGKSPSPATNTTSDPGPFKNITKTCGSLRVTKSPTSESVPYGGSCCFIAYASNASSITWYLANADGTVICEASEAAAVNNGLYVSGSRAETLSLSGIPSWMNGYQVQACFSSSEGKVYTDIAKIWTYAPQQEKCWWDYPEWWYLCPWDYWGHGPFDPPFPPDWPDPGPVGPNPPPPGPDDPNPPFPPPGPDDPDLPFPLPQPGDPNPPLPPGSGESGQLLPPGSGESSQLLPPGSGGANPPAQPDNPGPPPAQPEVAESGGFDAQKYFDEYFKKLQEASLG